MKCIVYKCRHDSEYGMVLCTRHLGCTHYRPSWWRRFLDKLVEILS